MYTTCIFCGGSLGRNEVVEAFPVGRRLAFDPARGRLWALCPRCRQWNLSALEERWEALEALERFYHDTPTRYSTGQVGLAQHREGLEAVRIGQPELPEYAAWRYGAELLRRRRRTLIVGGAAAVGATAIVAGAGAGLLAGGGFFAIHAASAARGVYKGVLRTAARVELPDGRRALLKERHAQEAYLDGAGEDDGWRLHFRHTPHRSGSRLDQLRWAAGSARLRDDPLLTLEGDAAIRAAGKILPALNRAGGSSRLISGATQFVEETATADEAFRRALRTPSSAWRNATARMGAPEHALYRLSAPVRLGLEMAAQESAERRAMEGELAELEREWQAAEEIAAIADDLLLPERIRKLKLPGR